ncbi:MAG TPA: hypothetical protein VGJ12_07625 [Gemmatimonadaceae bacterium]
MMAAALLLAWVGVQAATAAQGMAASPAGASQVQMGESVQPDTVTVGEHFEVRVRVRAPKGAEIGFPVGPDSGVAVEAVDPKRELGTADTTIVDRTAIYRLVAWTVGAQQVTLGSLVVSLGGADRRYAIPTIAVLVKSVRPGDSTGRVPQPARSVIVAPPVLWPWIVGGLLLLALLLWMLRRRLRRRPLHAHMGKGALADAQRDFARIDQLALLDAGERGRYVALHIDVLREYLAARIPEAALSLTSTELLTALRADAPVPLPRLVPVLAAADLIKYANRPVTDMRARELASETRAIVESTEAAVLHRAASAVTPERAA